ncbi:MAG: tripartite tricarboxylate transporter TctB family protein [Pseudomonadota bacterium]
MSDRIAGTALVGLALAFFIGAGQLDVPFFPDPLGSKAFPRLIAVVGGLAGLAMILRPDGEPSWPRLADVGRLAALAGTLVFYVYALGWLGFVAATALASGAMSYQIKPDIKKAALIGIGLSVGLFVVFKYLLGLGLSALPRW